MSQNSGHLLDALKGRQPDDDDPEQRLASRWRAASAEGSPEESEPEPRRSRFRRSGEAIDPEATELGEPSPEELAAVKRTRVTSAPEATRGKADAPKPGALKRLGGMSRALASGFRGGREGAAAELEAPVEAAAGRKTTAEAGHGRVVASDRRKVQLTHSEALLFVLVALVVVLSAYVIGKNSAGTADAGERPPTLSSNVKDPGSQGRVDPGTRVPGPPPNPNVDDKNASSGGTPPAPAVVFGVRVTSYVDAEEAAKQAQVFREDLVPTGVPVEVIEREGEFHLMVGRADKKDDPSLAALVDQFKNFARRSGLKPYAKSVEIQSF